MREGGAVRLWYLTPVVGTRARMHCSGAIADPEAGGRPGQDGSAGRGHSGEAAPGTWIWRNRAHAHSSSAKVLGGSGSLWAVRSPGRTFSGTVNLSNRV